MRINFKNFILILVKFICFLLLFYQFILLTIDYLNFPYNVKLEIINEQHFLPAITICSKKIFIEDKIKSYFKLTEEYKNFYKKYKKTVGHKKIRKLFLQKYLKILYKEFSSDKLELTISAKELINCSGSLHKFKDYDRKMISKCEDMTEVIESIYGQEFGKCFTYFANNSLEIKSLVFKNNDYIQFEIKREIFEKLLGSSSLPDFSMFVHNSKNLNLQYSDHIKYTKGAYNEFRFRKTKVNYLSWPYVNECGVYSGIRNLVLFSNLFNKERKYLVYLFYMYARLSYALDLFHLRV